MHVPITIVVVFLPISCVHVCHLWIAGVSPQGPYHADEWYSANGKVNISTEYRVKQDLRQLIQYMKTKSESPESVPHLISVSGSLSYMYTESTFPTHLVVNPSLHPYCNAYSSGACSGICIASWTTSRMSWIKLFSPTTCTPFTSK